MTKTMLLEEMTWPEVGRAIEQGMTTVVVAVGAVPRGIALVSGKDGAPAQAWVLNAVENATSRQFDSLPVSPPKIVKALDGPGG